MVPTVTIIIPKRSKNLKLQPYTMMSCEVLEN